MDAFSYPSHVCSRANHSPEWSVSAGERHLPVLHATKRDGAAHRRSGARGNVNDPGFGLKWPPECILARAGHFSTRDPDFVEAVGRIDRVADMPVPILMTSLVA